MQRGGIHTFLKKRSELTVLQSFPWHVEGGVGDPATPKGVGPKGVARG